MRSFTEGWLHFWSIFFKDNSVWSIMGFLAAMWVFQLIANLMGFFIRKLL